MEDRQAGITALITAYARAYHATHDSPKIFDDFLADQLYTPEEHIAFDHSLAGMLPMVDAEFAATQPEQAAALARVIQIQNGPITLSRSRFTEDCLESSARQGIQQYVILGAGFDTFAFRRPDLLEQLDVFEVDHPATQAFKRERVAAAGWDLPARQHFVPLDFRRQALASTLVESGYDPHKASFFSWQGVTFYLVREVMFATLQQVASIAPRGSTMIFDYLDAEAFLPDKAGPRVRLMQAITRQIGEPMKTGFDPHTLATELAQAGFRLEENLSPAEIDARYFMGRTDAYRACEQIYFARASVM